MEIRVRKISRGVLSRPDIRVRIRGSIIQIALKDARVRTIIPIVTEIRDAIWISMLRHTALVRPQYNFIYYYFTNATC